MNKYRNKPTVVDGIRFASKKEARRYEELKLLDCGGKITGSLGTIRNLELQPRFTFWFYSNRRDSRHPLEYPSGRSVTYVADFQYDELQEDSYDDKYVKFWSSIVEDVKGVQTPVFKLKAALMKAVHGIEVRIT